MGIMKSFMNHIFKHITEDDMQKNMFILNNTANNFFVFKYHNSRTDGKISVRMKIEITFIFRLHRRQHN
jgi:hypothetical protein